MSPCPTVRKKDDNAPGGYVVVNEEDFDESKDEIFVEGEQVEPEPEPEPVYEDMTKDELAGLLNDRDIDFSLSLRKDDLIALLQSDDEAGS